MAADFLACLAVRSKSKVFGNFSRFISVYSASFNFGARPRLMSNVVVVLSTDTEAMAEIRMVLNTLIMAEQTDS